MSDKRDSQVAAIRRLVRRTTGSKSGNVAGRRGPLGRTARVLTRSNQKIGGGRTFNAGRLKDAKRRSRIGKKARKR